MNAMKNAAHLAILALWIVVGLVFSLKTLFLPALLPVVLFWAWFAGYAAFTTWLTSLWKSALGVVAAHSVTFLSLHLVPKVMPFAVLRLGLDLPF
ncbi:MAG: hypothetical protein ACOZQL_28215 [Myxococcota bacterium]